MFVFYILKFCFVFQIVVVILIPKIMGFSGGKLLHLFLYIGVNLNIIQT